MRGIAMLREVIEKMHIPTPGAMHRPMHKQQRGWMGGAGWILGNGFELHV
jgi:hypothetical protein